MDFLIVMAKIVFVILCILFVSFLIRRYVMYVKLKSLCKELRATIKPTHLFWLFGGRNGKSNDFYIEVHNKVFSIKLFSMGNRRAELVFNGRGSYFIRKYLMLISAGARTLLTRNSKLKKIPEYNFKKKFREEWYIKELVPVLLVHPCRYDIMCEIPGGNRRAVDVGETFNGIMVIRLADFLRQIRKVSYEYSQRDKY